MDWHAFNAGHEARLRGFSLQECAWEFTDATPQYVSSFIAGYIDASNNHPAKELP